MKKKKVQKTKKVISKTKPSTASKAKAPAKARSAITHKTQQPKPAKASKALVKRKSAQAKPAKKQPLKKVAVKKVAIPKKKLVSRSIMRKKAGPKKVLFKKPAVKPVNKSSKKAVAPAPTKPASKALPAVDENVKALVLSARKRTATPAIFKIRNKKHTPVVFTLDEVKEILHARKEAAASHSQAQAAAKPKISKQALIDEKLKTQQARVLSAASLADILGFNPQHSRPSTAIDEEAAKIPEKFKRFYKLLVELRTHIKKEMDWHAQDTLRRSHKDVAADLASSHNLNDGGTETFDRDFALGLLSNEQDALFEIDEAIQRMIMGSYGTCEVTGQPIDKERLMAVPFTRCSLEGQQHLERTQRKMVQRTGLGVFSEAFDDEEGGAYGEDDEGGDS